MNSMSDFVHNSRFEDHLKEHQEEHSIFHGEIKSMKDDLRKIVDELPKKVSWASLVTILTISLSGVSAMFYLVYNQNLKAADRQDKQFETISTRVDNVQKTSSETQNVVSYLKGVLENSSISR